MSSSSSSPPTPPASPSPTTQDDWNFHFQLYNEADLILRSSDGWLFATRSFYLQAASSVFEDTLQVGSAHVGEYRDGRPLLRLAEEARDVYLLLRCIQRDRFEIEGRHLEFRMHELIHLSPLVEKYDLRPLATFLYGSALLEHTTERGNSSNLMDALALAVLHGQRNVVPKIIRSLHYYGKSDEGAVVLKHRSEEYPRSLSRGWRYFGLEDLSPELEERVPRGFVREFGRLHVKVLTQLGYSWREAAEEFKM